MVACGFAVSALVAMTELTEEWHILPSLNGRLVTAFTFQSS